MDCENKDQPKFLVIWWTESLTGGVVNVENDIPLNYTDLRVGTSIKAYWGSEEHKEVFDVVILGHADSLSEARNKVDPCVEKYNEEQIQLKAKTVDFKKAKRSSNVMNKNNQQKMEMDIMQSKSVFSDVEEDVEDISITSDCNKKKKPLGEDQYQDAKKFDDSAPSTSSNNLNTSEASDKRKKPGLSQNGKITKAEATKLVNEEDIEETPMISGCAKPDDEQNEDNTVPRLLSKRLTLIIEQLQDNDHIEENVVKSLSEVQKALVMKEKQENTLHKLVEVRNNKVILCLESANALSDEGGFVTDNCQIEEAMVLSENSCNFKMPTVVKNWRTASESKVEICKSSGVFATKASYDEVISSGDQVATKLVFFMLRVFYSEKDLSEMSACGTKKNAGIPPKLRKAIIGFVKEHAHQDKKESLTEERLNYLINKKCCAMRSKFSPSNVTPNGAKQKRAYKVSDKAKPSPKKSKLSPKKPKAGTKKSPAKKSPAKKSPAKKSPAKKSPRKVLSFNSENCVTPTSNETIKNVATSLEVSVESSSESSDGVDEVPQSAPTITNNVQTNWYQGRPTYGFSHYQTPNYQPPNYQPPNYQTPNYQTPNYQSPYMTQQQFGMYSQTGNQLQGSPNYQFQNQQNFQSFQHYPVHLPLQNSYAPSQIPHQAGTRLPLTPSVASMTK